jgi:hypothetical protein
MATALLVEGTDYIVKRVAPIGGITKAVIRTTNTVDATNTITQSLTKLGIGPTGFIGIIAFVETTEDSVYAQEAVTTSVSSGTLTLTIPAGTDNDRRFIAVYGHSVNP